MPLCDNDVRFVLLGLLMECGPPASYLWQIWKSIILLLVFYLFEDYLLQLLLICIPYIVNLVSHLILGHLSSMFKLLVIHF